MVRCALGLSCDLGETEILKQRDQATVTPKRGSSSFSEKEKMISFSFQGQNNPCLSISVFLSFTRKH